MEEGAVNMPQKEKVTNASSSETPEGTCLDATTLQEDSSELIGVVVDQWPSPSKHLANGIQTDHDIKRRNSLYTAALKGDWESAKKYKDVTGIWEIAITAKRMNTLQVAVAAKQTDFVKKLLKCMNAEELKFKTVNGDTALAITALSGSVEIARKMVEMNCELPMIRNNQQLLPLLTAASHRQSDMVLYLYRKTEFKELTPDERIELLLQVIFCDLYGLAMEILKNDSSLATVEDKQGCTALEKLARKPSTIGSRSQMSFWERCIGSCFKGVYHKASMRALAHQLVEDIWKKVPKMPDVQLKQFQKYSSTIFIAAELGNVEFLTILIGSDPDLIWMVDKDGQNIFHISIRYRQESVYNLIHEIGIFKEMIATNPDSNKNNMLHLAGQLAQVDNLNIVSGAALHMQRELLWFKEIEKIVPLAFLKAENSYGETPNDLFAKTHKQLHKDGEEWMRGTAMHCMLVATLIATVVFAATFTVPGGNDQGKGTPVLLEHNWFWVFFVSDSIALLSSSTSILIFLSILTSRYTEKDFLRSLPRRLMFGLIALFISIIGMVVAFAATCFLVYQGRVTRIPTVIITLSGVPIASFVLLHHELLVDIIRSTYLSEFLFRSDERLFHSYNWSVKRIVKAIKGF